jgi:hypothetical protein
MPQPIRPGQSHPRCVASNGRAAGARLGEPSARPAEPDGISVAGSRSRFNRFCSQPQCARCGRLRPGRLRLCAPPITHRGCRAYRVAPFVCGVLRKWRPQLSAIVVTSLDTLRGGLFGFIQPHSIGAKRLGDSSRIVTSATRWQLKKGVELTIVSRPRSSSDSRARPERLSQANRTYGEGNIN